MKGEIKIILTKSDSFFEIRVIDNGKGIKPVNTEDKMDEKPHALNIIRERINIINETNQDKASFDILPILEQNKIMGTEATFIFPLTIFK